MAVEKIHIKRFIELAKTCPVIDVRSPSEFAHAHIPAAFNLPLFTDEERKIVGTAYKQESREIAIKKGLDFFSPKMRTMIETVENLCRHGNMDNSSVKSAETDQIAATPSHKNKTILLYCWRGGMRSAGVAWMLDLYGYKVYTLAGGYKQFRNHVLEIFQYPFPLRVLGGYTGSGKTDMINELKKRGENVVNLEELASHKGSAFGNIGLPPQPTQEMFENTLGCQLYDICIKENYFASPDGIEKPVWIEDESQRIGLVNVPHALWKTMRRSPVVFLEIPFGERLKYLVREYGSLEKSAMLDAIGRIREKLGGLNAKIAGELLAEGNYEESFGILLKYYDKYYLKALHNRENLNSLLHTVECKCVSPENADLLTLHIQPQAKPA
jgi:tRNA 2-selenouridine synthase